MNQSAFHELAREIARLNELPLDIAEDIAAKLGDSALVTDGKATVTLEGETEPRTILWPTDL